MDYLAIRKRIDGDSNGKPLYQNIVDALDELIRQGNLNPGDRLPTIRKFSEDLGVSATTVAAAYRMLNQIGKIRSEVGRGTFVAPIATQQRAAQESIGRPFVHLNDAKQSRPPGTTPWRRRALKMNASRLRTIYLDALDCTTGRPDSSLLPLDILKKSWKQAISALEHDDLQYAGPGLLSELSEILIPRLEKDGIPVSQAELIMGTSAQQFMVLAMQVIGELCGKLDINIAAEEPGYATIFDTFERARYHLIGFAVDEYGAIPESLDQALSTGADAVLFTPRAHNPTGASWSHERMSEIASVLGEHPRVIAVEDDQFADAASVRIGSLLSDQRLEDRTIYIRSFSKSIGPDLRMAVAIAHPPLRTLLLEAKTFADGWSSRLTQRALALALSDEALEKTLTEARNEYAERRQAIEQGLLEIGRFGGQVMPSTDGVNIWVKLPQYIDAADVIEKAASGGLLVSSGEPFFIYPGRSEFVRCSVGSISREQAPEVGRRLANAILSAPRSSSPAIHV